MIKGSAEQKRFCKEEEVIDILNRLAENEGLVDAYHALKEEGQLIINGEGIVLMEGYKEQKKVNHKCMDYKELVRSKYHNTIQNYTLS